MNLCNTVWEDHLKEAREVRPAKEAIGAILVINASTNIELACVA